MTDTATSLSALHDQMRSFYDSLVSQIDEKKNQLDPSAAARSGILNQAVANSDSIVTNVVSQLESAFNSFTAEQIVGVSHALRKFLRKHNTTVETYVTERLPKENGQVKLTDEQEAAIREELDGLIDQAQAAYRFLAAADPAFKDANTMPSKARGAKRGAMGPRLKGTYAWAVDGNPVDGHKLGDVAKALEAKNVGEVRAEIEKAMGSDVWETAPNRIQFGFNGKTVIGVQTSSDSGDDGDEPVNTRSNDDDDDPFEDD